MAVRQIGSNNNPSFFNLTDGAHCKCRLVGAHVKPHLENQLKNDLEKCNAEIQKQMNLHAEKKAEKKEIKARLLNIREDVQSFIFNGMTITRETIDIIKTQMAEIIEFLKTLKAEKEKLREELEGAAISFHPLTFVDDLRGKIKDAVDQALDKFLERKNRPPEIKPDVLVTVSDAGNRSRIPGDLEYKNNGQFDLNQVEEAVQLACKNSLDMLQFLDKVFELKSFDGKGSAVESVVHYMRNYVNAFFDGEYMVYGDGNRYWDKFYKHLVIAAHEIGHAVTGARLAYKNEAGALNESFSDILGVCCEMHKLGISLNDYHWQIGKDLIKWDGKTYPLRTFFPGPAYVDIPPAGTDPQPDSYKDVDTSQYPEDEGGVHVFSKIPNMVFRHISVVLGDWEEPVKFWKECVDTINNPHITFAEFAAFQILKARNENILVNNKNLADVLEEAWTGVDVPYNMASILANESALLAV